MTATTTFKMNREETNVHEGATLNQIQISTEETSTPTTTITTTTIQKYTHEKKEKKDPRHNCVDSRLVYFNQAHYLIEIECTYA